MDDRWEGRSVGREYFPNKWSTYVLLPGNNFGYYRRVEMMMKVRIVKNIFYLFCCCFCAAKRQLGFSKFVVIFLLLNGMVKNPMLLNH
jgi:hypothetical protein